MIFLLGYSDPEAGQKATGITKYQDAVNATRINNDYFMKNRNGNCKFLNVLQGENPADADDWYNPDERLL